MVFYTKCFTKWTHFYAYLLQFFKIYAHLLMRKQSNNYRRKDLYNFVVYFLQYSPISFVLSLTKTLRIINSDKSYLILIVLDTYELFRLSWKLKLVKLFTNEKAFHIFWKFSPAKHARNQFGHILWCSSNAMSRKCSVVEAIIPPAHPVLSWFWEL